MRSAPSTFGFPARNTIALAGLFCVSTLCTAWGDEVYKSVDAQGHVIYSDRANSSAAKKTAVDVQSPDAAEAARLAKEQAILKAESDQRDRQAATDSKLKEQHDRVTKAHCDNARNRYFTLKEATRIFSRDAAGNRVYYSDADGDAKREEARKAMNAACGTAS